MTFFPDNKNVKLIGRTYAENEILWFALSGSGIEFTATAKKAAITLIGDKTATDDKETNKARYAVYVDDEKIVDERMDCPEKTITLFNSDSVKTAKIRFLKLSEASESIIGIKNITADEIKPTESKKLKIEIIGDSITCGYGIDGKNELEDFSTATEDVTKAYSYKTMQALNADYSFVAYSGHGIISGYTGDGVKRADQLVPPYYEKFAFSFGGTDSFNPLEKQWDFNRFVPELIIINLGTNDDSYCGEDQNRVDEYVTKYEEFLGVVRKHNPNAKILCILGFMGERLCPAVERTVENFKKNTGDTKIYCHKIHDQNPANGYGCNYHPTPKSHDIAVSELLPKVKEVLAL